MEEPAVLRVVHLVDAMGGSDHLWGKERVVALLMREQRASGLVEPSLVTFAPGLLRDLVAGEGFAAGSLSSRPTHGFERSVGRLARLLEVHPVDVIHSHGYRANIIARAVRLSGRARGIRLVSTCHGWGDGSLKLHLYNTLDRWTSVLSDVTTVPDPAMLAALPRFARHCHIHNAVPDIEPGATPEPFVRPGAFVVGTLGRVTAEKGIPELLAAATAFPDPAVVFTVAGDGDLAQTVRAHDGNVRYAGYFARPERYLEGLDVYVQASRSEGLSLALLEAMRAGKAIVATGVGATRDALTDGESALIVPAGKPDALGAAILRLRRDPALAARLGLNARARFEADFRIGRQHLSYLNLYGTPSATQRLAS
jgi:glycosyltransferase involved in cell wall biosynthesis